MAEPICKILVLHCSYIAWCTQQPDLSLMPEYYVYREPDVIFFTFSNIPPDLIGGERDVVLRPFIGGVKS